MISVASVITGIRLFLFGIFVVLVGQGLFGTAAVFFFLAWGLDVVDGWVARRYHQETSFGFLFDKIVDRVVIIGGVISLVAVQQVPLAVLLLLSKDVLLLPSLLMRPWLTGTAFSLGRLGKATSFFQGLSLLWFSLGLPFGSYLLLVTVFLGIVTAVWYYLF